MPKTLLRRRRAVSEQHDVGWRRKGTRSVNDALRELIRVARRSTDPKRRRQAKSERALNHPGYHADSVGEGS